MPHHVHVVLDEEHGHALLLEAENVVEKRLCERRVHTRHRLVEHDERGLAHESARHLEQLALTAGETRGVVVLLLEELEAFEQHERALFDLGLLLPPDEGEEGAEEALTSLPLGTELHVVEHGEQRESLRQLEGAHLALAGNLERGNARDAGAVERPLSRVGLIEAREQVEERRLAGTVGADECSDRAAGNLDVVDIDRREAAEAACDVIGDDDGVGLGHPGGGFTDVEPRGLDGAGGVTRAAT